MPTFLSILSKLWQIIATIICGILSVVIFCSSKLKELLEQNDKKTATPDPISKKDLFGWLDEYFSKKDAEKQGYKINSNFDDLFN